MNDPISKFNIELIILNKTIPSSVKQVKKLNIFESNSQEFEKQGLFSTEIFGPIGSSMRNEWFGYIDLKLGILHPLVFEHICSMKSTYADIFNGTLKVKYDPATKDFVSVKDDEVGYYGYDYAIKHIDKIMFKETDSNLRNYRLALIKKFGNMEHLITKWLVIPAGLRDYTVDEKGTPSEDAVNDLYRKLLTTVNMLNNINITDDTMSLVDPIRAKIQNITLEIYRYYKSLMDGKSKFIQNKWAKRAVMYGTRNVITPNPVHVTDLKADNIVSFNDTVLGIYQYIKSIAPITMNKLMTEFINKIMSPDSDTATLVNPKTMKTELVTIPIKERDNWLTVEGLNNIMNKMAQDVIRSYPVKVAGYYMFMMYDDGENVNVYFDTADIDPSLDKQYLRPITYVELMYLAIYDVRKKYPAYLTRYPVAGLGGIYPTKLYLKTTTNGRTVNATIGGISKTVYEYPIFTESYVNSTSPHYTHLARLGADFDGDTISLTTLTTEESIKEINDMLDSKEFYITPSGELAFSVKNPVLDLVLAHMSDDTPMDKQNDMSVIDFNELVKHVSEEKIAASLAEIYQGMFQSKMSAKEMQSVIDKKVKLEKQTLLICVDGNYKIHGFARYREFQKSDTTQPYSQYANTKQYGFLSDVASATKGCGSMLVSGLLKVADSHKVDVMLNTRNKALIPYYEKFGFTVADIASVNMPNTPKQIMIRRAHG